MASRRALQTVHGLTRAVPVNPLGEAERIMLRDALADVAEDWCVELQGICADEANLIVVPEDGDDAHGPSFVISREGGALRVDQVHWDTLTEVGTFASLGKVADTLRSRLAFCSARIPPASVTVH